ncbi:helix-turn-helix domain-containing protein [Micrococcales bacterium 31B]|nr:helix-turn-helix domain-containing protein [Micrococcales bacterium 31B]
MSSRFPLADLIEDASLGLTVIVPGRPDVGLRSAHASDLEYPGDHAEQGSALLTYGAPFLGREGDSRYANALLDDLERARVEAVFLGLGPHHTSVPRALESVARHRNLPLLTVPPTVPFYRLENVINEARLSADSYPLKRSLRITNQLLDSMSGEHPLKSLIATLGWSCRGSAALYDESGTLLESTGEGPTRLIFTEIMARARGGATGAGPRLRIGRWEVMSRSVVVRGQACTLAVASRNETILDDIGDMLLDTAQRLLAAMTGLNQAALVQQQHESNQLLTALQDGILPAREQRYWERLKAFRFEPYRPLRAVWASPLEAGRAGGGAGGAAPGGVLGTTAPVASSGTAGPDDAGAARATLGAVVDPVTELRTRARYSGLGMLLIEEVAADSTPRVLVLASDTALLRDWLAAAVATHVVGVSEPLHSLVDVPRAFHEAQTAWGIARQRLRTRRAAGFALPGDQAVWLDEVDLSTWLLARADPHGLSQRAARQLAELDQHEYLRETLTAYFALDLEVAACAAHLFVHPNTVRYRLKRCEEVLGGSLHEPVLVSNVYLALYDDIAEVVARLGRPGPSL